MSAAALGSEGPNSREPLHPSGGGADDEQVSKVCNVSDDRCEGENTAGREGGTRGGEGVLQS